MKNNLDRLQRKNMQRKNLQRTHLRRTHLQGIAVSLLALCLLSGCTNPVKEGTTALEEERYDDAIAIFQKVTETENDKKCAMAYRGIGIANYELMEYEYALSAFHSAIEKGAQQTPELYNLMGICAMKTENYQSALEYIRSGIALCGTTEEDEASGDDSQKDAGAEEMLREMLYNEVVCCEQLADWETAREKAAAYLSAYPDDEEMKKEAVFLETR